MPDDGRFTLRAYTRPSYFGCNTEVDVLSEVPIVLDGDGSWSVEVNAPAGLPDSVLCVGGMYDGMLFAYRDLYLVE